MKCIIMAPKTAIPVKIAIFIVPKNKAGISPTTPKTIIHIGLLPKPLNTIANHNITAINKPNPELKVVLISLTTF